MRIVQLPATAPIDVFASFLKKRVLCSCVFHTRSFRASRDMGPARSSLSQQHPCFAASLIATRPGVMCAQTGAMGKLPLPDGSSQSAGPDERPADLASKAPQSTGRVLAPSVSFEAAHVLFLSNRAFSTFDASCITVRERKLRPSFLKKRSKRLLVLLSRSLLQRSPQRAKVFWFFLPKKSRLLAFGQHHNRCQTMTQPRPASDAPFRVDLPGTHDSRVLTEGQNVASARTNSSVRCCSGMFSHVQGEQL